MKHNISLKAAGIVAGSAAVCAFLFGVIITASLPSIANRGEASPESMQTLPLVAGQNGSPFTPIARRVTPAVVNISAEKTVDRQWRGFDWNFDGPFGIVDHGRAGARYETVHGYSVDRDLLELFLSSRV